MTIKDLIPSYWNRKRPFATSDSRSLGSLQDHMNRLFDNFFEDFGIQPFRSASGAFSGFNPHVSVTEDAKSLTVTAELPGMDERDIDLSITKDALRIRGEKKSESEHQEGKNCVYNEMTYGSFERVIPLSFEVEEDKVDASFKKGVLTVQLPKSAAARRDTKKISIRSA